MFDPSYKVMTRNRGCELFTQTVILRSVIVLLLLLSLMFALALVPEDHRKPADHGQSTERGQQSALELWNRRGMVRRTVCQYGNIYERFLELRPLR